MVKAAIREFYEYYYTPVEFRSWQNDLVGDIYSKIAIHAEPGKLREVPKVFSLCEAMSDRQYRNLKIESRMIHGYQHGYKGSEPSGVEFLLRSEDARCELADMVLISLVTIDKKVVLLKTAFVQNKDSKAHPDVWRIDPKQLFLLKNFPTFKGKYGIFKDKSLAFLNHTGTLGNYGLFLSNGDMTLLTARNVFRNQQSNAHITFDDIRNESAEHYPQTSRKNCCNRCKRCCDFNYCD